MPMPEVPEQLHESLIRLGTMDSTSYEQLRSVLESLPPARSPHELTRQLRKASSDGENASVLEALYSLDYASVTMKTPLPEVLADVAEQAVYWDESPEDFDGTLMRRRAQELLDVPSLRTSIRAGVLETEYDHVALDFRIVTDLRPVFEDGSPECQGSMIVHNLRVRYRAANDARRKMVFAMDEIDLSDLKRAIERAESKAEALAKIVEGTQLRAMGREKNGVS